MSGPGAHFLSIYQTVMAQLPPDSESTDVPTSFGSVRAYWIAGGADVDDSPPKATLISAGTTDYVLRARVELWADASHAINGEYPAEIAARAGRF